MNESTQVVGLTGPMGSGKDTVADLLTTHCGAHKLAFADALRGEIEDAFNIERVFLTRRETKEHPLSALALAHCLDSAFVGRMLIQHQQFNDGPLDLNAPRSPRQIMQWWGTEYRRKDDTFYWVRKLSQELAEHKPKHVVISDIRELHEAAYVKRSEGHLLKVIRPGLAEDATSSHSSEKNLEHISVDGKIFNTSTIEHLRNDIVEMEKRLK